MASGADVTVDIMPLPDCLDDVASQVSNLVMVGVSHHTADLGELERHVMTMPQREALLATLLAEGFTEATVLATCSRSEIYALRPLSRGARPDAVQVLRCAMLAALDSRASGQACQARTGDDAVAHLFRVAAGLDSRLIGERDVQPQVRDAGHASAASGAGHELPMLFRAANAAARRVHRETAVGSVGRSLGSRAVERGLALAGTGDVRVVVVGSGCMARLVVQALAARQVQPLVLARDVLAAARLTGDRDRVRHLDEAEAALRHADLVIVATSADTQLVKADQVRRGRADRPLTIVDLAVPRNVDMAVAAVAGVTLLDVAALHDGSSVDDPWLDQVEAAEAMVAKAARCYSKEQRARGARPLLQTMRSELLARCRQQLARATLGALDDEALDRAAAAVVGPVLHAPAVLVQAAAADGDQQLLALVVRAFRAANDAPPVRA